MHAILSIYHMKCSCQRNLKVRLIFLLFMEAVTIHRFTAVDIPANTLKPTLCICIVCSRAKSTGTLANDFPVLLTLKPPSVEIFCRSGWLVSKLASLRNSRTSNEQNWDGLSWKIWISLQKTQMNIALYHLF